jgi:hypothetical protein
MIDRNKIVIKRLTYPHLNIQLHKNLNSTFVGKKIMLFLVIRLLGFS